MKLTSLVSAAVLALGVVALPTPSDDQTQSAQPPDINDKRLQDQIIRAHNWMRGPHCAQRLTWDDGLAQAALAGTKACGKTLDHYDLGTNLAGQGPPPANREDYYYITWNIIAHSWGTEEEAKYDYNHPGFSEDTGHFTQVVWRDTSRVGCAWNICPSDTPFNARFYCGYHNAGNISPFYPQNVWPRVCAPFPEVGGRSVDTSPASPAPEQEEVNKLKIRAALAMAQDVWTHSAAEDNTENKEPGQEEVNKLKIRAAHAMPQDVWTHSAAKDETVSPDVAPLEEANKLKIRAAHAMPQDVWTHSAAKDEIDVWTHSAAKDEIVSPDIAPLDETNKLTIRAALPVAQDVWTHSAAKDGTVSPNGVDSAPVV
ncbi:PR-1-like protein [Lophium mytilinum]|uniref:PR-1-like protein n=1 Tax=Lophium mytilinum TaxID=390894 RepID=A0A6A6RCC5_9PEZI|nr:PR-1-like protein [Lophium mytilinum]